jgi:hypothetical protein
MSQLDAGARVSGIALRILLDRSLRRLEAFIPFDNLEF